MPPAVPLFAFDFKRKIKGISETRTKMFFAEFLVPFSSHLSEFGHTIYGPQRRMIQEAKGDQTRFEEAASRGPEALRRVVATLAPLGGTRSHPHADTIPVLMDTSKPIRIFVESSPDAQEIKGVRRSHVFAVIPKAWPSLILERVVDCLTDLLSCSVDSQLGICPPVDLLLISVRHAISRETSVCSLLDDEFNSFVKPLAEHMVHTAPWSVLQSPSNEEELEVITGFIRQFLDKSRLADLHGERKQIKRIQKQRRDLKKSLHTVFVSNVPWETTEAELHTLFSQNVPGVTNPIYKVLIPKDEESGSSKGYALVICRSKKATRAVLDKTDWNIRDRSLNLRWRDPSDEPVMKRQRTNKLPAELEEKISKAIRQNPGCNVSQIPNFLEGVSLEPQKYGFKNLTHALQSVPSIYLELGNSRNVTRPVYLAYPK